jgi:hypothetical protein
MDYRALLVKYIWHVDECEGAAFITTGTRYPSDRQFTSEEWGELVELEKESRKVNPMGDGTCLENKRTL